MTPLCNTSRPRVLVVDDCLESRSTLCLLLGLWGYECCEARDGPTALLVASLFRPDVVLLDIDLPGMDGYEVGRRLRAVPGLEMARLMAVADCGPDDQGARDGQTGFSDHLVKPLDPEQLRRVLACRGQVPPAGQGVAAVTSDREAPRPG
jgi:CheY-like chemotaxis protein